jgi:AraC-like DNA-binding protein
MPGIERIAPTAGRALGTVGGVDPRRRPALTAPEMADPVRRFVIPERARQPRSTAAPSSHLRSMLGTGYAGFDEQSGPRYVVLPATASVGLIVKICDSEHRPPAYVMGALAEHTVLDGACSPSYLRVFLNPLGAYRLLGMPMTEVRGRIVELADVVGPAAPRLIEQLREQPTWHERFEIVDRLLRARLDDGPRPTPEVQRAWQCLAATGGRSAISRIAGEVGWSHKHLITRFRQQVGLPPKTVARLIRFGRVLRGLHQGRTWERIAAESGYADQPHLIREFRTFTGTTPTDYVATLSAVSATTSRPAGTG